MRFTIAAIALAGSALAHEVSTAYTTNLITVIDCEPTVTDCPADSTTISTSWVPVTTSVIYTTKVHTITDCGPEVPDCPAHSTITSTESIPVSTTTCDVITSTGYANTTYVHPTPSVTLPVPVCPGSPECPPEETTTAVELPTTEAPACPTMSVTAITKSYTTVLTSVEYSTIEVPCPTTEQPSVSLPPPTTAVPPPAGNTTTPVPPPGNAAGSVTGSVAFAAIAGVAAYILA
jgi:hypothetical protein